MANNIVSPEFVAIEHIINIKRLIMPEYLKNYYTEYQKYLDEKTSTPPDFENYITNYINDDVADVNMSDIYNQAMNIIEAGLMGIKHSYFFATDSKQKITCAIFRELYVNNIYMFVVLYIKNKTLLKLCCYTWC
jgi:hypothetical protein